MITTFWAPGAFCATRNHPPFDGQQYFRNYAIYTYAPIMMKLDEI